MALPKAIERQVAEANAAQAAIEAQSAVPTGVIDDPSQLQAPAPEPQVAAPQTPAPAAPPTAPSENWEHKYRTLQGLLNKQRTDFDARAQTQESELAKLRKLVTELQAAKEAKQEKAVADPKDVEAFGADMVEMVQRYAERVFQSMASKTVDLDRRVAALEQQVTGVSQKTEMSMEQHFYAALGSAVPNWSAVNEDPKFMSWLAELDPVYGVPRKAALDVAYNNLNAPHVISIFKAFIDQHPPVKPESLAQQVAPSSVATPAPATSAPAKPIFSAKFVEKVYNDLARGRYASNPAEGERLRKEIDLAAVEQRIR